MFNYTALYTDKYQLTIAQTYFLHGQKDKIAIFDYFFRKLPFDGGYAIFAGLKVLLSILETLHFSPSDLAYLHEEGFDSQFLAYLKDFRFTGKLYSCLEGELIFPLCPVISVEANIIEAQIIETLLLNTINFQTLIATKASRMRQVAGNRTLLEYGLRRAQGTGGYSASRAAFIGGFDSTSNLCAARDYQIPSAGTMAHSLIQSYDSELAAFRDFAQVWPNNCVLLIDTYSTLKSGLPNAITIAKEMESKGHYLKGVRLDSGDLAYLAKIVRIMLDEAGLDYVKIVVSNQLDEYIIKSLIDQDAPIDIFGVGTNLIIGYPTAALDGVYKLAKVNEKPCIKISETIEKISLPDKKQVYRLLDDNDNFAGVDVITLITEETINQMIHPFELEKAENIEGYKKEPLLQIVMEQGKELSTHQNLNDIKEYAQKRLQQLPEEYKRFNNPHLYKIGLSSKLKNLRENLLKNYEKFL